MTIYTFVRSDSPAAFLIQSRLSTDVLNALVSILAAGHPIEYSEEMLQETEIGGGEAVILEVTGPSQLELDIRAILAGHGVKIYSRDEDRET